MPQRGSTSGTLTHQPAGVHDLEPHSKDELIQQQSLHVRHALSGSGLEGDLGERDNRDRQLSDTLTTIPLTRGLALFLLVLGTALLAHWA